MVVTKIRLLAPQCVAGGLHKSLWGSPQLGAAHAPSSFMCSSRIWALSHTEQEGDIWLC